MSTKLTPSDFTASLTDNLELNSRAYGSLNNYAVTSCDEVDQRIVTVAVESSGGKAAGTYTTLFQYKDLNDLGTGITAEFQYFRITNLDTVNSLRLQIIDDKSSIIQHKLPPGAFYQLFDDELSPICEEAPAEGYPAFNKIMGVRAAGIGAAIEVEYVTVFKPVAE